MWFKFIQICKGPKIWNSLPNNIKQAISITEFKFLI